LLWRSGYIRDLALLVSLSAIGAALLDYVLKAAATASYGRGAPLLRFFGIYYTATSLATLLLQPRSERAQTIAGFGLVRTVATQPCVGGSLRALAPALTWDRPRRGAALRTRCSLGLQLFYTPVSRQKRAVATMVDAASAGRRAVASSSCSSSRCRHWPST
jgi:hypothetical protein